MSISDKMGQRESITEGWRALEFFTDRDDLIRQFLTYVHAEPPKEQILFLHGEGGNGKSLLIRFLREYCCRYWGAEFISRIQHLTYEQLIADLRNPGSLGESQPVPYAYHDFAPDPNSIESILSPDDVLRKLRADVAGLGFQFPLYTFATVRYLLQARKLPPDQIKAFVPKEEADLAMEIINLFATIPGVGLGKALIALLDKHFSPIQKFRAWWTEVRHRRKIGEAEIEAILRLDPERELPFRLPELFAQDLNEAMKLPNAPPRLVLFFDTHEAFWGDQRDRKGDLYHARDEWLRRLLVKLELSQGIIAVVAGRELPSWSGAGVRVPIASQFIDPHLVGNLSTADALHYLELAEIAGSDLRQVLVEYTSVGPGQVHPLYLGFAADIALAAQERGENLAPEDFDTSSDMDSRKVELVNRFRRYVDDELVNASDALAACRAFDWNLFDYLGEQLGFQYTEAAFNQLLSFSFVWRDERHGTGWYRIHDLIRRIFQARKEPRTRRAHEHLESYYRQRGESGDPTDMAEAIYHANRLDWKRGVDEWIEVFEVALRYSRYTICRALLEVRAELAIEDPFQIGRVSQQEGDYYAVLALHREAHQEYVEAISSYDAALKIAPDDAHALNNKGNVLQRLGDLQAQLSQYEQAEQSSKLAVAAYDAVLKIAPDDAYALNNKGNVLQRLGELQAQLSQYEQAEQSYQLAVASLNAALKLAPNDAQILNNKGNVLQSLGDLQAGLAQHEQAEQSYQLAVAALDAALKLAPDYVYVLNNKGGVLRSLGDLQAGLAQHEQAEQSYQLAVAALDAALKLAPDYAYVLNNKGGVLKSLGDLQTRLAQHEQAEQSYQRAVASYDAALKLAPDYAYVLNNKGNALQSLGMLQNILSRPVEACSNFGLALIAYTHSLRIAPNDTDISGRVARLQALIHDLCE